MRMVRTARAMQKLAREWQCQKRTIAFVPTMGFLHEGHASLIREARRAAGTRGLVVVSIFVNPTQFAPNEDLAKYPRNLPRDQALCQQAGADIIFHPSNEQIYPSGPDAFSTYVIEEKLSQTMEGKARPTHFRGVTTVVAKLFNLVLPDLAFFGAKDFQQAAIVQKMVRDLNFPVQVVIRPTVREPDGLALSSRNKYLAPAERASATILWRSIAQARARVKSGKAISALSLQKELSAQIQKEPFCRLDYLAFFDPRTLEPKTRVVAGSQMALAVFVGRTRLIDNARL